MLLTIDVGRTPTTTAPTSAPARMLGAPDRSLENRDEFGLLAGAVGLFQAVSPPSAADIRDDSGHAVCGWLPREDLL